ncbi:MAG: type II toxin-antitoxin system YafQ family toxin [Lentisphaeria bacterium]|jgi:mRNA interferase YafQ|nr:type II toxin-antitoxin system YafQ family toxin [Lentisphaeria bacterium]MDY0176070.1 type II toxin-antitoxin system YafQ family toxin [Lentisphaeria bacterium]NLZ60786.1 type II toxin-antitoxin system YafQ family toxin [Lentisphaerota bacterium]
MKYEVKFTSRFKKDFKIVKKRNLDLDRLYKVIEMLGNGLPLPKEYCDHALVGNYKGARECHIMPDWLLIYGIHKNILVLELMRTGSHSDLF